MHVKGITSVGGGRSLSQCDFSHIYYCTYLYMKNIKKFGILPQRKHIKVHYRSIFIAPTYPGVRVTSLCLRFWCSKTKRLYRGRSFSDHFLLKSMYIFSSIFTYICIYVFYLKIWYLTWKKAYESTQAMNIYSSDVLLSEGNSIFLICWCMLRG